MAILPTPDEISRASSPSGNFLRMSESPKVEDPLATSRDVHVFSAHTLGLISHEPREGTLSPSTPVHWKTVHT